ncbi:hypothetical protein RchiOBHm_Chr7g0211231 [Rosa chinensis]|uniref:Uncharacterized protein n=1 Tax=Rosa chinensis TaxID=74649 RepID=A0A2P6PAE1_ROSCH|nr:hypothetical protein RchiOBHm_Chr7g0211231 [Rosa chinensis]
MQVSFCYFLELTDRTRTTRSEISSRLQTHSRQFYSKLVGRVSLQTRIGGLTSQPNMWFCCFMYDISDLHFQQAVELFYFV